MTREYLSKKIHFKRVIAEGNLVVEHCDVLQVVRAESAHNNSMF